MFHLLRAYFSGYRYLTSYTLVRVLEIGKFTAFLEVPLYQYGYDPAGNLASVTYSDTRVRTHVYNEIIYTASC